MFPLMLRDSYKLVFSSLFWGVIVFLFQDFYFVLFFFRCVLGCVVLILLPGVCISFPLFYEDFFNNVSSVIFIMEFFSL